MQGSYPIVTKKKDDYVEPETSEDIIYDLSSSIADLRKELEVIYYGGCYHPTDREVEVLRDKLYEEEKLFNYYLGVASAK